MARITGVYSWAAPIVTALNASPMCNIDPACIKSRDDLNRVVTAYEDGSLGKLSDLGRQLKVTQDGQTLDQTLRAVGKSLDEAVDSARKLGIADAASIQQKLNSVQQGASQLADASQQLAEGVQQLVDKTREMGGGLDQASAFLLAMKRDAANPPMSGFYIPPEILTQAEFKKAATLFISADGHTARYLVQTALDPFSTAAMDQVQEIIKTAESASPTPRWPTPRSRWSGFSVAQSEIRDYYNGDIEWIIIVTLIMVFLILVALLRAIVAPIYLVAVRDPVVCVGGRASGCSSSNSFSANNFRGTCPGMAFLVLVAVGADYNLLLISRIREEAQRGIRSGVIKTVGATGGVITSAGLIFAASMFGLTVSSISNIVQVGFIIGVGLLLDTFLVRTITVPAMAVLVGKANWWPSKSFGEKTKNETAMHLPDDGDDAGVKHVEWVDAT